MTTTKELLAAHNALVPEDERLTQWKRSKDELAARIADLQAAAEPEAPKPPRGKGIGLLVRELLVNTSLTYKEIEERVRDEIVGAQTTTRSIASVARALRKQGVEFASRRPTKAEPQLAARAAAPETSND